jgi:hypothetical protein
MQNKPNFLETQMNLTPVKAKYYGQKPPLRQAAKQTQFKPNQTQFQMAELGTKKNPLLSSDNSGFQARPKGLEPSTFGSTVLLAVYK